MLEYDSSINVTSEQGANGSNGHKQPVSAQFDEKLFHLMVESATEYAIFAIDLQGNIVTWNTGAERVFGYSEDQILGRDFSALFTDGDRRAEIPRGEMKRALENGSAEDERWHLRSDGTRFWAAGKLMPLKNDDGEVSGFVKICRDQTERRQAHNNLSSYETRFQEMIRQSPLSTFVQDAAGWVKYVNPAFTKLWGVTLEDLADYNALKDEQADALGIKPYIERAFAGEAVEIPPIRYDPKQTASVGEGNVCWVKTFVYPIKGEDGQVLEVVTMHEDVSHKIKHEEEQTRNEQRLTLAQEAGNFGSFDWDMTADEVLWSAKLEAIFGLPPGGFASSFKNCRSFLHPEDLARCDAEIAATLESKLPEWQSEFRILKANDGDTRWIEARTRIFYDENRLPIRMIGVGLDITERRRGEEESRRNRERFEALVQASSQIVWTTDINGKVNSDSPSWRDFTGQTYEEWLNNGWGVVHPDDREHSAIAWKKAIETQSFYETEYRVRHKSGEYRWTAVRGVPLRNEDGTIREWVGMNTDITDRKQSEQALRQSHARREFVLESSKIGEWELDLATGKAKRSFIHDQCFGATEPFAEWSYDIFISYVHPDDRPEVERKFGESIKEQKQWDFECRVVWADQSVHWIHAKGSFYRDKNEKPTQMLGIVTEITEQKKAEEALRASEELSRSVIASSPDCFKILDGEGHLQFMNENGLCLLEIDDFEPFRGEAWESLWEGEGQRQAAEAIKQAQKGQISRFQGFCPTAKGTPKWWDVVVAPVRGANGQIGRLLSVSRDITQIKHAEHEREQLLKREQAALKQSEMEREKLRSLFQQAPAIVNIQRGPDHIFELVHPLMYQLLGERDLIGKPAREAVPEVVEQGFIELLDNVYKTGEPYFGKETFVVLTAPEGNQREGYFDFIYHPWRDLDGNIAGIMTFAVEVTDRVLARQLMEKASAEREEMLTREQQLRQTAEEASRLKDEFLAIVSHELRTPLNAILGWSQMMRNNMIGPDRLESAIETINRNAISQAQLIDDLLDITRIITGKLRLNVRDVDLASIISSALQTVRPAAEAKNITLDAQIYSSPAVFSGDPERLQQIVWNLLSNAVKFTPKGGRVAIKLESRGSHYNITVTDTGEGIDPDFLPFVFDRFRQADMSSTRKQGGLGLGLSIVRHLVEMHGGGVYVESKGKGHGATFTIVLPLKTLQLEEVAEKPSKISEHQDQSAPTIRLEGINILLVDDEPDTCLMLNVLLEGCGATVRTAASVREALEVFAASPPDVLISDIAMPEQDGYELIKRIRELPESEGGKVPAVALTAYAGSEDRKKAIKAGFQSHVPKPVNQNSLVTVLASLV
ncbi:MAG: PAS domain S-box protein [Acidobacteriota bacterium]|nr:PAS domain S-box protein [Acidobacteriota bacterium]